MYENRNGDSIFLPEATDLVKRIAELIDRIMKRFWHRRLLNLLEMVLESPEKVLESHIQLTVASLCSRNCLIRTQFTMSKEILTKNNNITYSLHGKPMKERH